MVLRVAPPWDETPGSPPVAMVTRNKANLRMVSGEKMRSEPPRSSALGAVSGRIKRLPSALVDQIAAGEVVERPASVVKELVENALDAGATRLRIELREGGNAFIAVSDDGMGMSDAEARLALERHATSKIASLDDLQRIASFGFRGEALPAIASVARLRLATRRAESDVGHEIRVESGVVTSERSVGCPVGTRIEVADLFGAVPARRKFLKKPGTEWGHAIDWLGRLAMSLPGVHFEILRDDREAAVWPATDDAFTRIEAVLGRSQTAGLRAVVHEEPAGHVEAFVTGPEHTRANANGIHLYVNGRPVRDRLLRHALLEAYRDWLPRGRYPTAVLYLTVDPARVDVNVHPAKWEVRFESPQAIHALVRHAVREAMTGRDHLDGVGQVQPGVRSPTPAAPVPGWRRVDPVADSPGLSTNEGATDWIFAAPSASATEHVADATNQDQPPGVEQGGALELSQLRLIGQMLASYLILEADDGLILIDQHAAHESVLYQGLRRSWLARDVERQGLLLPVDVELDPLEVAGLEEASETVHALGFELERFGDSAVVVRAIPALLAGRDPAAMVRDLAEELAQSGVARETAPDATRLVAAADRLLSTLACHSARRFGDHLEPTEQQALLRELDRIPWAQSCPHGRPVATRISRAEIEGRFGRH